MAHDDDDPADEAPMGLAEAQIAAIEDAFAARDRLLAQLRRELADLRAQTARPSVDEPGDDDLTARLTLLERRMDEQEEALRHIVQQLIALFERDGAG